ncbi:hypothetical protein [Tahibacter harae]|uniref:DUF1795 domain-containing protein n=1 Tax=Tahibacter harae TaxID=2963937 RepID=A0ABT1QY46_9GAMM|nr:hypothetical protein [Tahibacter harae]MCQ4167202.1 hypothetical protein [Tahibacter harae]
MHPSFPHRIRAAAAAAVLLFGGSALAGGYVLELDGRRVELDLDQPAEAVLADGKRVTVRLERKAEQVYREKGLSFAHPATIQPSATDINAQVRQLMLVSANGNGVILQRYSGLDPTALIDLMVKEMTDEEVAAGYERKITPDTQKLADGRQLRGKLARTESADEAWDRHILAIGDERGGFLVVTMMERDREPADVAMLQRFWASLVLE